MKTKLFYLFIALFAFNFSGNAQTTSCTPGVFNCISLIGPGTPAGNWDDDNYLSTLDGDVYTGVDWQFSAGHIKFRANGCWETACTIPGINVNGWGPLTSEETGWPSYTNSNPVSNGPNIQCPGGVWNVKFTLSTNSWEFTAGTPNPVIKLTGTAVSGSPVTMLTTNGKQYTLKKVTLVPGTCQFDLQDPPANTGLMGGTAFPSGTVTGPTDFTTITTTGIDYDVTFDYLTGAYSFAVATFPSIAIVGSGTPGGWPVDPQIDPGVMTTTDGNIYTLSSFPIKTGEVKFRQNNGWNPEWGGSAWPSGTASGGNIPTVAGNYNITLNVGLNTYAFTLNSWAVVGSGVPGGWPPDPQPVGYLDPNLMSTVDGVNYTLNGLVVTSGAAKFRQNNGWSVNTGGSAFPAGTSGGGDIPTVAGTYNLMYNALTGAYDFGTALAVNKFDVASFRAYPNPTRNSWNITSNDEITSVQVYDVLGKAVYTKFGADKEVTVNASELSKGVYFAKVSSANGTTTLKLIKE